MLERFGFTPTEGKVYQTLLQLGPATGYAVALELGIARANVYHSLESLARRGAVRRAAGTPVRYSAAGPAALLGELERAFKRDLAELEDDLHGLPIAAGGPHALFEPIVGTDRLLARAASCADAAVEELFAVTGPWGAALNRRLEAAAARRVPSRLVSLGQPAPSSAVVRTVAVDELRGHWGGLPLVVVADGSRAVCGVIGEGGSASGLATSAGGVVPFLRHLVRRELGGQGG